MRILAVSNLYPPGVIGGYELACAQMVEELRARGHDVAVLTAAPPIASTPGGDPPHVRRELSLGGFYAARRLDHASHTTRMLGEARGRLVDAANVHALLAALERERPDAVHLWNLEGLGGLGLLAALRQRGVPWTWQICDAVPRYMCTHAGRIVPGLVRAANLLLSGTWLPVSRGVVTHIEDAGIVLDGPLELVSGWLVPRPPGDPPAREPLAGRRLRVVFAGDVAPHKGVFQLIEALARVRAARGDAVEAVFCGAVATIDVPARIAQLGLRDVVTLVGHVDSARLRHEYARADVFAFPTWETEAFGLAPLEAAAEGCVPIVTATCGIAEWLVDGVHCLKAERTAAAFAARLLDVLDGEVDLAALRRRGHAAATRDFALPVLAPRVEAALAACATRATAPTSSPAAVHRGALVAEQLAAITIEESAA